MGGVRRGRVGQREGAWALEGTEESPSGVCKVADYIRLCGRGVNRRDELAGVTRYNSGDFSSPT